MPLSPLREELIGKVKEGPGRDQYRTLMEAIPDVLTGKVGRLGPYMYVRAIKGTQRLQLKEALLTKEGLCTADGQIADCGAALVKVEPGEHNGLPYDVKRHAGKESGDVHRIKTAYYDRERMFGLSTDLVGEKLFDVAYLQPAEGRIVQAKMGDSILEGVLVDEENLLTEHIRACLAPHEKDVAKIRVLLRHPSFKRISDTVDYGRNDIRTLFTDGSQLHIWNAATRDYENKHLSSPLSQDSSRPGMTIEGDGILPMMEDVIESIRVATDKGAPLAKIDFADLTVRCKDAQQHPLTGELTKEGNEAKSWRIAHRPRVGVGPNKSLVHTAGVNAHIDPASLGDGGKTLIRGGAMFVIDGEKKKLRR